jgi:hypothetical protein
MKYTNKFDLPECFERFNTINAHTKAGAKYSVTEVIDSPLIPRLRALHASEIEVDISDRIMAILGTAVHNILEQGAPEGSIVESRMETEVSGVSVSGQIDLMTPTGDGGFLISDYKTCRGIALKMNPWGKPEWSQQLNLYALIAKDNGFTVSGLEVIAIVRDWNAGDASRSPDYPQQAVVRLPIPQWDLEEQHNFLSDRVGMHSSKEARPCTPEEMWERPTKWAVHRRNKDGSYRKRAHRVCDTRAEADGKALEYVNPSVGYEVKSKVVERPGARVRCEGNYCSVSEHCPSWSKWKSEQQKGKGE